VAWRDGVWRRSPPTSPARLDGRWQACGAVEALCWACARRVGGAFSARAPPAAAARCSQSRQGAIIRRLAPALTTPPRLDTTFPRGRLQVVGTSSFSIGRIGARRSTALP
jgi:hypothetical protein